MIFNLLLLILTTILQANTIQAAKTDSFSQVVVQKQGSNPTYAISITNKTFKHCGLIKACQTRDQCNLFACDPTITPATAAVLMACLVKIAILQESQNRENITRDLASIIIEQAGLDNDDLTDYQRLQKILLLEKHADIMMIPFVKAACLYIIFSYYEAEELRRLLRGLENLRDNFKHELNALYLRSNGTWIFSEAEYHEPLDYSFSQLVALGLLNCSSAFDFIPDDQRTLDILEEQQAKELLEDDVIRLEQLPPGSFFNTALGQLKTVVQKKLAEQTFNQWYASISSLSLQYKVIACIVELVTETLETKNINEIKAIFNTVPEGLYKICLSISFYKKNKKILQDELTKDDVNLWRRILEVPKSGILHLSGITLKYATYNHIIALIPHFSPHTVRKLYLRDVELSTIPAAILHFAPQLVEFNFSNNPNIKAFPRCLTRLPNLQTLSIGYNCMSSFTTMHNNTPVHLPQVQTLMLNGSNIQNFHGLQAPKLRVLKCKNCKLTSLAGLPTKNLRVLDISNNYQLHLSCEDLALLKKCKQLQTVIATNPGVTTRSSLHKLKQTKPNLTLIFEQS